jgi:hypothetical protein
MRNNFDYIGPIKDKLDAHMHIRCVAFIVMGSPRETPRYMNFGEFDIDRKILTIESTQTSSIFFKVQAEFDFIECDVFWEQFKQYRTEFLVNNYPTIKPY